MKKLDNDCYPLPLFLDLQVWLRISVIQGVRVEWEQSEMENGQGRSRIFRENKVRACVQLKTDRERGKNREEETDAFNNVSKKNE